MKSVMRTYNPPFRGPHPPPPLEVALSDRDQDHGPECSNGVVYRTPA